MLVLLPVNPALAAWRWLPEEHRLAGAATVFLVLLLLTSRMLSWNPTRAVTRSLLATAIALAVLVESVGLGHPHSQFVLCLLALMAAFLLDQIWRRVAGRRQA